VNWPFYNQDGELAVTFLALIKEWRVPGAKRSRKKDMVQKRGLAPSHSPANAAKTHFGEVPVPVFEPCWKKTSPA